MNTEYDVIIWDEKKTVIGSAHEDEDGLIAVSLRLLPRERDEVIFLKPVKRKRKE